MILLEFEVTHLFLPMIVEEEISVGIVFLSGLLGPDYLFDVTFQGLVRNCLCRRNLGRTENGFE